MCVRERQTDRESKRKKVQERMAKNAQKEEKCKKIPRLVVRLWGRGGAGKPHKETRGPQATGFYRSWFTRNSLWWI